MKPDKNNDDCYARSINDLNYPEEPGETPSPPFPSLYDGRQFLFVDASLQSPIELSFYKRHGNITPDSPTESAASKPDPFSGHGNVTVTEPVILSKYRFHGLQVRHGKVAPHDSNSEEREESVDEPFINLFTETEFKYRTFIYTLITDKKIYRPGEEIRAAVFAPSLPGVSANILIRYAVPGAEPLFEESIQLNHSGAGFCSFSGIEAGEYELALEIRYSKYSVVEYAKTVFSVAEYSLSLLEAKLLKYETARGRLYLDASITRLNSPFTGKISAEICDDKTGFEIVSEKLFVNNGTMSVNFELPLQLSDPFYLRIITEDGGTAEIHFSAKPSGVKDEISLGMLGNNFTGSVHPLPGSRDLGWFYASLSPLGNFPLELREVSADKAFLVSSSFLKKMQVVLINPLDEKYRVFDYDEVAEGREFSFEIDFPYTVIHAAAWGENPMESWGVVFKKSEIGLELETPDVIEPGQDMKIRLGSTKPVKCLLTITDSRVESENPVKKAGSKIYETIAGYGNLISGEVEEIDREMLDESMNFLILMNRFKSPSEITHLLPEFLVKRYTALPIGKIGHRVVVAMENPGDILAVDDMKLITGYDIMPVKVNGKILRDYIENLFIREEPSPCCESSYSADYGELPAGEIPAMGTLPIPTRSKFPEVIHFEMLDLDGTAERTVKAGDQPGTWKCCAYAVDGFDFTGVEKEILSTKECFVEIDAPSASGKGDEIYGEIRYNTGGIDKKGTLKLAIPGNTITEEVQGEGSLEFMITEPGEFAAEIRTGDSGDRVVKNILPLSRGKHSISRLQFLHDGETIAGDSIEVYPSLSLVINDCVDSLMGYPFGCAEQTAAKLYGLSIIYSYALKGRIDRKPEDIAGLIKSGLNRLPMFFHPAGMFSLWEDGIPTDDITVKVITNLLPFRNLPFALANLFIDKAVQYLKHKNYRDNRLLPLGKEFLNQSETLCDLVNLCFCYRDTEKVYDYAEKIKALMQRDKSGIFWRGRYPHYWSGDMEATCDALCALWICGEKQLCLKGLARILASLEENMLYSTSDTVSLLKLLDTMDLEFSGKAEVRGEVISPVSSGSQDSPFQLSGKMKVSGEVKAVGGDIPVKTMKITDVDYLDIKPNFPFRVELKQKGKTGIPACDFKGETANRAFGKPGEELEFSGQVSARTTGRNNDHQGSLSAIPHSENTQEDPESFMIMELDDEIYAAFLSLEEEEIRKARENLFSGSESDSTADKNTGKYILHNPDQLPDMDFMFIEPPPPPDETGEADEWREEKKCENTGDIALSVSLSNDGFSELIPIEEIPFIGNVKLSTDQPPSEKPTEPGADIVILSSDLADSSDLLPFHLPIGKKAYLTITPLEWSLCPLCRILLPGNLALLKSGGNVQQACIPIKNGVSGRQPGSRNAGGYISIDGVFHHYSPGYEPQDYEKAAHSDPLTIEIAAVRKGKGMIYVVLTDMYDSGKKGLSRGVEVLTE